jgi:DNA-binding beta-propeller fold protein YncE
MKLQPDGTVVMTLGTKGEAGTWDEATGSHKLNQPNDVALAANGDIFVVEGHTPGPMGDPRVLKFDKTGKLLMQWGGRGTGPGQFVVAHGAAIDADGHLWVLDRENQRIEVFDTNGRYLREMKFAGLPCSIVLGPMQHYMVNGFAGQVLRLDGSGKVLNAMGKPGKEPGEYGEAHFIAISPAQDIFVADSVNGALTKYVKKR